MADEQIPPGPHGLNRYTGKRAQRIERMREKLWEGIENKRGKLDKDVLIAVKMLMELDGIGKVSDKKPTTRKGRKEQPASIKLPALLESA